MILWFSGTGNSRRVAEELGHLLGQEPHQLTPGLEVIPTGDECHVWVFPIYSWGVPPYVLEKIKALRFNGPQATHHMVATCGDDCGLADKMWRRAMAEAGHTTGVAATVIMPNNYVSLPGFDVDSPELEQRKLAASPARVAEVAEMIKAGQPAESLTRGAFAWVKTRVIYPWFVRMAMNPRKFSVTDACISCGRCERACPVGCVRLSDGHPVWSGKCAGCLACYHVCPIHAINYGRWTRGKGQYKLGVRN